MCSLVAFYLSFIACSPIVGTDSDIPDRDTGQQERQIASVEVHLPSLSALLGNSGTFLWLSSPLESQQQVERETDGQWLLLADEGRYLLDEADDQARYRVHDLRSDLATAPLSPTALGEIFSFQQEDDLLFSGETVSFALDGASIPQDVPPLALHLVRVQAGEERYLDGSCLTAGSTDCWVAEPSPLQESLAAPFTSAPPSFTTDASEPGSVALSFRLSATLDDGSWGLIQQDAGSYVDLAYQPCWGEVHAHTNLSFDGCEDPEADCQDRGEGAATDFFQQAVDRGLDFAAITDHAEYSLYYPEGEGTEPVLDIWATAQQRVARAEAEFPDFIPILGYEWTNNALAEEEDAEHRIGGHRTLMFDASEVCTEYYIGYGEAAEMRTKDIGVQVYIDDNPFSANTPSELQAALEDAAAVCGRSRVLVTAHHTGVGTPQPLDWTWSENAPDYSYTSLVEIFSEHGCSECTDVDAEGCDWGLQDDKPWAIYESLGGVQTALAQGFLLGFAGGTDSHDGRPGSLEDGPSCISGLSQPDDDGVQTQTCHTYSGALTGALVSGEFTREHLFDALFARHTMATNGPRLELRVALQGADDGVYLPGDAVPAASSPFTLRVEADEALLEEGGSLLALEVITPTNDFLLTTTEGSLREQMDVVAGDIFYLRLRVEVDGEERRVWVSPFFVVES